MYILLHPLESIALIKHCHLWVSVPNKNIILGLNWPRSAKNWPEKFSVGRNSTAKSIIFHTSVPQRFKSTAQRALVKLNVPDTEVWLKWKKKPDLKSNLFERYKNILEQQNIFVLHCFSCDKIIDIGNKLYLVRPRYL